MTNVFFSLIYRQQKADQQSSRMAWLLKADRNLTVARRACVGTGTGDLPERISWKCKTELQKNARSRQYDMHRHNGHVIGWFSKHVLDWLVDFCFFFCVAAPNYNVSKLQMCVVNWQYLMWQQGPSYLFMANLKTLSIFQIVYSNGKMFSK